MIDTLCNYCNARNASNEMQRSPKLKCNDCNDFSYASNTKSIINKYINKRVY